jgi:hypothetical protein
MTSRPAPRTMANLVAVLVAIAALLTAAVALAGGVQFRDTAELLTPSDREAIVTSAQRLPFDVRVITTTAYRGAEQFDAHVRSQLGGADQVIIGLDPANRRTAVYCGQSTRIEGARCKAAADAGKQHFRDGRWGTGVQAVLASASEGVATSTTAPVSAPAKRSSGSMFGIILLGAVGLIAIVAVLSALLKKRQPPIVNQTMSQGPPIGGYYGNQPPPQPYPYQGGGGIGGGGIGSHIAAAGLGGLAGYGLGRAMGEHHQDRDDYGHADVGSSQQDDVGGGGSDWDSGGGSDDGGGGSDW